jgi:ABC-type transporter Mla maintaining outer membrane lipid asymmetry permease subunit MlaE
MTDILKMVLTHFWPFVAAVVLIATVGEALAAIVGAWRKEPKP